MMFNNTMQHDPARRWSFIEPDDVCGECYGFAPCEDHPEADVVSGGPGHVITCSEQQILAEYRPYWEKQMIKAGKADLISDEACIEDWVVLNWAEPA